MTQNPATTTTATAITSDDPLSEPLLSNCSTFVERRRNMVVEWPETPVPLYLPKEWGTNKKHTGDEGARETCVFQYDAAANLLKLVSNNNNNNNNNNNDNDEGSDPVVIDVLDPEDIVGVSVEIHMSLGATTQPRATTGTTPSNNNNNNNDDNTSNRPLNAPPTDALSDTQGHAILTIYAYPRRDPNHPPTESSASKLSSILRWCGHDKMKLPRPNPNYQRPVKDTGEWQTWGNRYPAHRCFTVVASEDVGPLNALVKAMKQAADIIDNNNNNNNNSRGKALVIVNPKSGPHCNAEEIYENVVNIMLEQANVDHDLCVTTHSRHAQERMAKGYNDATDHGSHKDIAAYSAIICMGGDGIVHECLQGIKDRDDWQQILKQVTFGIIGAGTANGMAGSIAKASQEQSSILDAAFLIAKGYTKPTDISLYQTTTKSYVSFLTFSWAMMSSIDIESEHLRFLGTLRFDVWAVWSVLKMTKYRAKFSYLPPNNSNGKKGATTDIDTLPALTDPIPSNDWVTEEDDFLLFWASHVSHAGEKTHHSPMSKLDDGIFQILTVRAKNTSRLTMAKILIGLETASHVDIPQAEFIQCTAYRLEPITTRSINDLDGEVIEAGPVQAQVIPSAMKVFCK